MSMIFSRCEHCRLGQVPALTGVKQKKLGHDPAYVTDESEFNESTADAVECDMKCRWLLIVTIIGLAVAFPSGSRTDDAVSEKWLEDVTASQWETLHGDQTILRISKHLSLRTDLTQEAVDPKRPLSIRDLSLLLRLSNFLIDGGNALEDRTSAATALGWLQHRRSLPALLAVMRNSEENKELRGACAEALGYVLDPATVGYLIHDGLAADEKFVRGKSDLSLNRMVVGPDPPRWPEVPKGQLMHKNISEDEHHRQMLRWKDWWRRNQRRIEFGRVTFGQW